MFWKNLPDETTPRNAENLSRSERYLQATAGANGDFYVNIDGADGLANGDTLKISFPTATNGTSNARLSIDNGNSFKNIFSDNIQLKAGDIQNTRITLIYDGTNFQYKYDQINAMRLSLSANTTINKAGTYGGIEVPLNQISRNIGNKFEFTSGRLYYRGESPVLVQASCLAASNVTTPYILFGGINGAYSTVLGATESGLIGRVHSGVDLVRMTKDSYLTFSIGQATAFSEAKMYSSGTALNAVIIGYVA